MKLRLREIRQSKGVTQTFIAKKLGYKYASGYNAIELGNRRLDAVKAKQIADILGVDMEELFFDDELAKTAKKTKNEQAASSA